MSPNASTGVDGHETLYEWVTGRAGAPSTVRLAQVLAAKNRPSRLFAHVSRVCQDRPLPYR